MVVGRGSSLFLLVLSFRSFVCLVAVVAAGLATASARSLAAIVVNELYYDHPGTDAAHEFVEILHTGEAPADLSGVAVEFHNGAGGGWVVLWRAGPGISVEPGALFIVGGELVEPEPDAVTDLGLQNGPDAVRLVAADGTVLDMVGYGGLDDPMYVEGRGAPPLAPGESIARIPDGHDTGNNAADFVATSPTPGRYNVARHDVVLERAPGTAERAVRFNAGIERIGLIVSNYGQVAVLAGAVSVSVRDSTADGVSEEFAWSNSGAIAPGEQERIDAAVALARGYHWLTARATYALDERPDNDKLVLVRRAGRVEILVSEVASAPLPGCPQFVELYNAATSTIDVGRFRLRDSRAATVALAADSLLLEPGGFLAVAADPVALRACFPRMREGRAIGVDGAWPTFNRTGHSVADSVVLVDALGLLVDAVAYPPPLPGRSLERVDLYAGSAGAVWQPSSVSAGATPAAANSASLYEAPAPGHMEVHPSLFSPHAGETLRVVVHPTADTERVVLRVFDLSGRAVADLGSATAFPFVALWNGREASNEVVPAGLYVLACEEFTRDGARARVQKVVIGCAARER